jgi:cyclic dehypoxanthinyl futalosine synthase
MIEENVVSARGTKFILNAQEIERLIRDAGFIPKRRNTRYELLD